MPYPPRSETGWIALHVTTTDGQKECWKQQAPFISQNWAAGVAVDDKKENSLKNGAVDNHSAELMCEFIITI